MRPRNRDGGDRRDRRGDARPAQADQRQHRGHEQGLRERGAARRRHHVATHGPGRAQRVQPGRERPQRRVQVDVVDRHLRVPGADPRHQLRGGEAAAAVGEEVGLRVGHRHAEDLRPALGQPALGRGQQARRDGVDTARRRAAATAARRGRPCPTSASAGRRPPRAAARARRAAARAGRAPRRRCPARSLGHDVPHQHLVARPGAAHGSRRAAHPGQREQRGVDLAQLDAPPAELDLLVGAPAGTAARPRRRGRRRRCGRRASQPSEGSGSELRGVLLGSR